MLKPSDEGMSLFDSADMHGRTKRRSIAGGREVQHDLRRDGG
jgi:hypothetical protein